MWHQLYDREADRIAGVGTFVQRQSPRAAMRFAAYVALPIELAGLAVLLWRLHSPWPVLFVLLYAAFAILKSRVLGIAIVIAEPRARYAILGMEYYTLLFPLAILLSSALRASADWAVLYRPPSCLSGSGRAFIKEARVLLRDLVVRRV